MDHSQGELPNIVVETRMLYPRIHDRAEFRHRFSRLFRESHCLYLLFSPGLGYGVDWLIDHDLPEGSRLFIFEGWGPLHNLYFAEETRQQRESDPALEALKLPALKSALDNAPHISFCPARDIISQRRWLQDLIALPSPIRRVRALRFCSHPQGIKKQYDVLESDAVRTIRQHWQNHSTALYMAPLWIRNIVRNIVDWSADIRISQQHSGTRALSHMETLRNGREVLLCGAGISLEGSIQQIDKARKSKDLLIAAVDTALPALLAEGIVPELVFMLEAQFANMDDFICDGGFRRLEDARSTVVHDISSHPPTLRRFSRRIAVTSLFAHSSFFSDLPMVTEEIPPLGSVGVAALYLLLRHTHGQITVQGFDFAFPPGRTHCRQAPFHQRILRISGRLEPSALWAIEQPVHRRVQGEYLGGAGSPAGGYLLSDKTMEGYFERFCEVIALYGHWRVCAGAHSGLAFPPGLLSSRSHSTARTANKPRTGSVPGPDRELVHTWLSSIHSDLKEIREGFARLLLEVAPPAERHAAVAFSGMSASIWAQTAELLEKRDFIWRFLPGITEITYSARFVTLVSQSLPFWIREIAKQIRRLESRGKAVNMATGAK